MQPRRSFAEAQTREQQRQALAKRVAKVCKHDAFSARIASETDLQSAASVPASTKPNDAAEQNLMRQAVHFASSALREAGLNSVRLAPGTVTVQDAITNSRSSVIRQAAIALKASALYSTGQRVATKGWLAHLSFNNGKFSLDSFEKGRQAFAINKASIAKITAMEDKKCPDCGKMEEDCTCSMKKAQMESDDKEEDGDKAATNGQGKIKAQSAGRQMLEDAGYIPSGMAGTWISPHTGEVLSFEQARQEMMNPPEEEDDERFASKSSDKKKVASFQADDLEPVGPADGHDDLRSNRDVVRENNFGKKKAQRAQDNQQPMNTVDGHEDLDANADVKRNDEKAPDAARKSAISKLFKK